MESKESIAIDAILAIAQQLQVLAWLLQWVTQDETSASPILVRIVWLCLCWNISSMSSSKSGQMISACFRPMSWAANLEASQNSH